jgi:CPA1 family monovalent cation:H+ antiporter
MSLFAIFAILITLTALFSYINYRYIHLPRTIGVMLIAMLTSLALVAIGSVGLHFRARAVAMVTGINFSALLLHGMLAFLLFAGALHLNTDDLRREWLPVSVLAGVGTLVSTFLVGGAMWLVCHWIGLSLPFIPALLFGALISPTDPIAVLGMMKQTHAAKSLETQIAGESLFNDGIGVAIFLVLLTLLANGQTLSVGGAALLLAREAAGGVGLGLALGLVTYWFLKSVDNYQIELLFTIALAMGGYVLAEQLNVSAPITIVVAGLLIGNRGRTFAMSAKTKENLDTFWELIDEVLNSLLFLLIGLEILEIPFSLRYFWASLAAVAVTLLARWICVGGLVRVMQVRRSFAPGAISVLTWGGLRGGISVAMSLSLPIHSHRDLIFALTYSVVVFSVVVQGLTISRVIRSVHKLETSA